MYIYIISQHKLITYYVYITLLLTSKACFQLIAYVCIITLLLTSEVCFILINFVFILHYWKFALC